MASNTKIKLLLGLVVILVIAFLLNGLLSFDNARDCDDLLKFVIVDPLGIKPDIPPGVFPPARVPEWHSEETPPPDDKDHFRGQPPGTISPDGIGNEPMKQAWSKVYIVCKGDNLADISKMFYGPKEGNRRAKVKRVFEANSKSLESPDKIYPGQKLVIPPLWASASDKNSIESIFPDSIFEMVESIGKRHL